MGAQKKEEGSSTIVTTFGLHESFLTRLEQMFSFSVWQGRTERARRTAVCSFSDYVAFIWSDTYTASYIRERPVSSSLGVTVFWRKGFRKILHQ